MLTDKRVRGPSVLTESLRTALRPCESSRFSHAVEIKLDKSTWASYTDQVDFTCPGTCVQWHLPLWLTLSVACLQRGSDAPVSHRFIGNRGRCGFKTSLCLPSSIFLFLFWFFNLILHILEILGKLFSCLSSHESFTLCLHTFLQCNNLSVVCSLELQPKCCSKALVIILLHWIVSIAFGNGLMGLVIVILLFPFFFLLNTALLHLEMKLSL